MKKRVKKNQRKTKNLRRSLHMAKPLMGRGNFTP